jgi:hypothetical protein
VVAHCASAVHIIRHAVALALQAKSPHGIVVTAAHAPAPLHPAGKVSVAPMQLAARHETPAPG